jgi:hypothetical protein
MLTASALHPVEIALAKTFSAVILVLSIVLAGIPILALTTFLGGVQPGWILAHLAAVLSGTIGMAAVGVFISSIMPRSATAIPVSYLVCLLFAGALYWSGFRMLPFFIEPELMLGQPHRGALGFQLLNSLLMASLAGKVLRAPSQPSRRFARAWLFASGLCVLALVWLWSEPWQQACFLSLLIGLHILPLTGRFVMGDPLWQDMLRRRQASIPGSQPTSELSHKATGFSGRINPVFAAERQTRLLGRRGTLVRIAYFAAIGSQVFLLLLTLRLEWLIDADSWVHVAVQIFIFLGWLICGMLSATSLPSERERATLPLLQTSLLSMREITLGKWLGSLWYGQILIVAAIPLLANAALTETIPPQVLVRYGLSLMGGVIMASSLGMWIALASAKTSVSVGRWLTLSGFLLGLDWAAAHSFLPRISMVFPTPWGEAATAFLAMRPHQQSPWRARPDPLSSFLGDGALTQFSGEIWLLGVALCLALATWMLAPWAASRWSHLKDQT